MSPGLHDGLFPFRHVSKSYIISATFTYWRLKDRQWKQSINKVDDSKKEVKKESKVLKKRERPMFFSWFDKLKTGWKGKSEAESKWNEKKLHMAHEKTHTRHTHTHRHTRRLH